MAKATGKGDGAATESQQELTSVASQILGKFVDAVEKDESLKEVAPRLRKAVLDSRVLTELSIRAALFPDAT